MERLYIVDKDKSKFNGRVINTMHVSGSGIDNYQDKPVDYCNGKTFAQLNKEEGGNLIALCWDNFYDEYFEPHNMGMQKPFRRTTKANFWDALECLPPKRWTSFDGGEFFFLGECHTADLYSCYVRKGNNYYTALRSIYAKTEDLINMKKVK